MLSVTAAILIDGDRVLIAQRGKAGHLAGKWEFPGGKIEPGESPEECLVREMNEEFGIDVAVTGFFGKSVYKYERQTVELLAYYVSSSSVTYRLNAHAAMEWVPLNRLDRFDFAPADIPFAQKLQRDDHPKPADNEY